MNNLCELQAVLVSFDDAVIASILPSLAELGIAATIHAQSADALETLARQKTDAFFVDREFDPELVVLQRMRTSPSSRSAVAFAIEPKQTSAAPASGLADFVMHKPLSTVNIRGALRAAYGIMLRERRRYFRHSLRIPVNLQDSTKRKFVGQSINVSQTGIAVECSAPLAPRETVQLEFCLPGTDDTLNCQAQIIWTAEAGKAGLTFTQMKSRHRERLSGWMENEFQRLWPTPAAKASLGQPQMIHAN